MLLIGTDEGIYRWTEGNNWPIFHGLQDRSVVALATPGAGLLAALDDAGRVWESGDTGQNWRELPVPEVFGGPTALSVGGTPASILIGSAGPNLFRRMIGSSARARSIVALATQAGPRLVSRAKTLVSGGKGGTATAVSPSQRTSNLNGWSKLGAPKLIDKNSYPLKSIAATESAWFAAVPGESLWKSTDDGLNWSRIAGLPADVHTVREVPGDAAKLFAATSEAVWFSADSGLTWEERSKGLDAVKYVRTLAVCPDEPTFLLAGAGSSASAGFGLFESKDSGKSWVKVVRSFPESTPGDALVDILFDPAAPTNAAAAFASGELWMTLNGGDYWQPFARTIQSARVLCGIG